MSQEVDNPANKGREATFSIRTDVRLRRTDGFRMLGMYEDAEAELARVRGRYPEAVEWWIADAYATRRCESIEAAREILIEGEERHVDDPGIKYNLACYACRLGDSGTAMRYLMTAISLDSKYKEMAFADEDLTEVHEILRKTGLAPGNSEK